MDIAYIASELARAGILREALPDAMHRAHEHFSGSEPSTSEMDAWCQDLPKAAAHLFGAAPSPHSDEEEYTDLPWEIVGIPEEAWHAANPAQRRTWARQAQAEAGAPPVPPHPHQAKPTKEAPMAL